jgi:hypothetical protein
VALPFNGKNAIRIAIKNGIDFFENTITEYYLKFYFEIWCKGTFFINMQKYNWEFFAGIVDLTQFHCLLFNILIVTMVSIVKNIANTMKKSIRSISLNILAEDTIGFANRKAIPILRSVSKRKPLPTLFRSLFLT